MKKTILFFFPILFFVPIISAQTCTGGGAATPVTLTMTGRISFDEYGDVDNQTGTINAAITGDVVGVQVTGVNLTTVGASWCSEATVDFINPTTFDGITYHPSGQDDVDPCNDLPTTDFYDLAVLGIVFPTGASGAIDWELSEDFDDNSNAADANWTAGTITLFVCPTGQILPVEMKSFEGKIMAQSNLLYWATAAERNVQWHIIERSVDGIANWTEIGKMAGQRSAYTTQHYSVEDLTPLPAAYYRVRTVDMDGKAQFSKNISLVRNDQQFGITAVIPSPTTGATIVGYATGHEENVTLRVTDMTGRIVLEQAYEATEGINNIPIDLKFLQSGVYLIMVNNGKERGAPVRVVKL